MTRSILIDQKVSIQNLMLLVRRQVECGADLHLDSRAIQAGDVFIACPGIASDGKAYIHQAIERGAAAVLIHADASENWAPMDLAVPSFAVPALNSQLGALADAWYEQPSAHMRIVAITGTNGKTSCAQWLADALLGNGQRAGVIGTLGVRFPDGSVQSGVLTTPDVVSMHRNLAALYRAQTEVVAIEASSIGIDQGRLDQVRLLVAAFTNLSRDHLDYHESMQTYESAKARLFAWPALQHRIVNTDDQAGLRLAQTYGSAVSTYGVEPTSAQASFVASTLRLESSGIAFTLQHQKRSISVHTHVLGKHNVSNLLCVAAVLAALGWPLERIALALTVLEPVEGRLQKIHPCFSESSLPTIVVDYAHTPDALERALQSLRELAQAQSGKLWCVFGCGGNRDAGKRPLMGAIVQKLADHGIVTSDNPRQESPQGIIAEIVAGLHGAMTHVTIQADRAQAILQAVLQAGPHDVVLVAGKGHETYQEINGERIAFDDRQWAQVAMLLKGGKKIQTDSRKIEAGSVFLALRGENFDGHDYLAQVGQAGVIAAIVDQVNPAVSLPQVVLGDTRQALLQLGQAWRAQFQIPVIAVTGSNGKTTTKEMIASILSAWRGESHRLATAGNLNNELGVPLTLLRLSETHRCAVIELGMNHPGEIAVLAQTAQPTVALVNNAQREHQEFMVSVEAVARENGQVFASLAESGVSVYPADDVFATLWEKMSSGHTLMRFGLLPDAEVHASAVVSDVLGTSFVMHTPAGECEINLPVPGTHNLRNALAAAACALAAGAPLAAVQSGLSSFHAVSGRMQPHRLPNDVVMIDDTYNANPDSVRAAIEVLANLAGPRVLALGDMGEVGDNGPAMHREVGAYARQCGIDHLLTLGDATKDSAAAFGAGALACASTEALSEALAAIDAKSILIKGSRFMRMERVVQDCLKRSGVVSKDLVNHAV